MTNISTHTLDLAKRRGALSADANTFLFSRLDQVIVALREAERTQPRAQLIATLREAIEFIKQDGSPKSSTKLRWFESKLRNLERQEAKKQPQVNAPAESKKPVRKANMKGWIKTQRTP